MLTNDDEYQRALEQFQLEKYKTKTVEERLRRSLARPGEIQRALGERLSEQARLGDEISRYERWRKGDLSCLGPQTPLGERLVALRIARGLSQKALADQLGVAPPQLQRLERNGYRDLTRDLARRITEVLTEQQRDVELMARLSSASRPGLLRTGSCMPLL